MKLFTRHLNQGKIVVNELEPAIGDQTTCEGLVTRLITVKQIRVALNFSTLDRFKV